VPVPTSSTIGFRPKRLVKSAMAAAMARSYLLLRLSSCIMLVICDMAITDLIGVSTGL
jgi:hypothetical protein